MEKQVWLVKSLGHILGPYSIQELEQALRSQKVTLIDEVKQPKSRWRFIRETPELLPIVEEIRNNILQKKETTNTEEIHELTKTDVEITHIGSPKDREDLTPTPEIPRPSAQSKSPLEPKKYVFDLGYDTGNGKGSHSSQSKVWPALFLATAFGVTAAVWWWTQSPQVSNPSPVVSGFSEGVRLYSEGLDEKAAEVFLNENLKTLTPDQQMKAVKPLLSYPIHSFVAQDLLMSIPVEKLSEANADEVLLMRAAVAIESQLWNQVEIHLKNIKRAVEWKAILQLASKVYSDQIREEDLLQQMARVSVESISGIAQQYQSLILGLSAFRRLDLIKHAESLNLYYSHLVKLSEQGTYFRNELLILKAALERKLEKNLESMTTIEALINEDPELHRKLRVEVRLPHQSHQKKMIQEMCEYLLSENSQGAIARGFRAFCHLKQDDFLNAQKEIESARKLFPAELAIMPLEGFILLRSGQLSEVAFRDPKLEQYPSPLKTSLRAEICFRNFDRNCGNQLLAELNLPWLTDLQTEVKLRTYEKLGLLDNARKELSVALARNSYYLPYYQIRSKIMEAR